MAPDASKAAFAITSELNDQIKAAASADEGTVAVIEFADEVAVETAQAEKEQEIMSTRLLKMMGPPAMQLKVLVTAPTMAPRMTVSLTIVRQQKRKVARLSKRRRVILVAVAAAPAPAPTRRTRLLRLLQMLFCKFRWILRIGTDISLEVVFSEDVKINGTLALTLQLDGSTVTATFTSDGTTALGQAIFSYTIAAGDSAASINYAGTDSLAFVGQGTLVDFSRECGHTDASGSRKRFNR